MSVVSVTRPNESKTNSTSSDQDFASVYTIPANAIDLGKVYRVTITFIPNTGVSSVTTIIYLKLGSTKVYAMGALNLADSSTKGVAAEFLIIGTAAPGASVSVEVQSVAQPQNVAATLSNTIAQPVAGLATNGTLDVVPGVTFSGTGSTETITVATAIVEDMSPGGRVN